MPYEYGKPLKAEESRQLEFKTVTSANPVRAIADVSDVYAVAFLNSQGGKVLWGVRDDDKAVVGVALTEKQRDEVRLAITDKLHNIEPKIDPTQFRIAIDRVRKAPADANLFVVSLVVPRVKNGGPFFASGTEAYVRLDGSNKRLAGPALAAWIAERTGGRDQPQLVQDRTAIEIYYDGRKLPADRNAILDFRNYRSSDQPSVAFDFHFPAEGRGRRKERFGLITSSAVTVVADWGHEWAKLTVLPDGRHLFQSEMMAFNLLPGGWHKYTFTASIRGSILELDRVEEMAFRFVSEEGVTDVPFGLWMIGKHLSIGEEMRRIWRKDPSSRTKRRRRVED